MQSPKHWCEWFGPNHMITEDVVRVIQQDVGGNLLEACKAVVHRNSTIEQLKAAIAKAEPEGGSR